MPLLWHSGLSGISMHLGGSDPLGVPDPGFEVFTSNHWSGALAMAWSIYIGGAARDPGLSSMFRRIPAASDCSLKFSRTMLP